MLEQFKRDLYKDVKFLKIVALDLFLITLLGVAFTVYTYFWIISIYNDFSFLIYSFIPMCVFWLLYQKKHITFFMDFKQKTKIAKIIIITGVLTLMGLYLYQVIKFNIYFKLLVIYPIFMILGSILVLGMIKVSIMFEQKQNTLFETVWSKDNVRDWLTTNAYNFNHSSQFKDFSSLLTNEANAQKLNYNILIVLVFVTAVIKEYLPVSLAIFFGVLIATQNYIINRKLRMIFNRKYTVLTHLSVMVQEIAIEISINENINGNKKS